MRVLLTGVPGWLGSRFLEILVKGFENEGAVNDWQIRCLAQEGVDVSFINKLSEIKKIECFRGDITKGDTLIDVMKGVDLVFHVAGIIHAKRITQLYKINTLGTENLLQKSVEFGVKGFIYISSNSVAGTNTDRNILMKESDPPRPYFNYGLSKFKAEFHVKNFCESGKIETVILRPCWFYGPNQPLRQTTFFNMIKQGKPIIFGDGENLRSMSYVDNVCQAMFLVADNSAANGQTYWIADEHPYSTNEIYSAIAEVLEVRNFNPRHVPNFVSETFVFVDKVLQMSNRYIKEVHVAGEMNKNIACSIEKAKKELGYEPKIGLKEGMRRSIEWCCREGINI